MTEPTPKIADDVDAIYEGIQRVRAEKQRELQMTLQPETAEPEPDAGMFACLSDAQFNALCKSVYFGYAYVAEDGLIRRFMTEEILESGLKWVDLTAELTSKSD